MKKLVFLSLCLLVLAGFLLIACQSKKTEVNKAFYYWKSSFELNNTALEIIQQNKINTLYIKYFDVVWDNNLKQTLPVAKIEFKHAVPGFINVVPVVYITNNSLQQTNDTAINSLAASIAKLIKVYEPIVKNKIGEIQIDCDWNLGTKEKYFKLLNELKHQLGAQIILSATIRLHQIKYASTTGIPPVQKGMLMYYNMGNIQSVESNSIFNEKDASNYAAYIKQYPLPLDAVLPMFSWIKIYRNKHMYKLLNQITWQELKASGLFEQLNENTLKPTNICNYKGITFLANDYLVAEHISPDICTKAAQHLKQYFKPTQFTLALFHLSQSNLNEYKQKDFENIYSSFN